MIYLVALILGVALPVAVIYIIELFKYKIEGRADVEKITSLPIVGDVPFSENKSSEGAIVVHEKPKRPDGRKLSVMYAPMYFI